MTDDMKESSINLYVDGRDLPDTQNCRKQSERERMRIINTTLTGTPFDHETIRLVWEKARKQPGFETFSLDVRGTTIGRFEYGRKSSYGWVIHRVIPQQEGGTDEITNLQPLHWKHLEDPTELLTQPPNP